MHLHAIAPPTLTTTLNFVHLLFAGYRKGPRQPFLLSGASQGLEDLDSMTFRCPQAGLNAAAREAARVPSQGNYQFSYFKIINDSSHSTYEVHFKSNYAGEVELKYSVSVYCQQGIDPASQVKVKRF